MRKLFYPQGERDKNGKKALLSLLQIKAKGGPKDLSKNLDHYLYGSPKRKK